MAVTQYIGARYVPLFADPAEWDSTREYEPLTVVLNQGASYTSRQYVPIGIEISNTNFWVRTADYNAQVNQYRQEVQTFDNRITANATAISDETSAREGADDALNTRVTANATAISDETSAREAADDELDARVTSLEGALEDEETARANADASLDWRVTVLASNTGVSDSVAAAKSLQELIDESRSSITQLETNVSTIQTEVGNLQVSAWDGAKYSGTNVLFFGDSFLAENIQNSNYAYVPNRLCTMLDANKFNFSYGGAGWGRSSNLIETQVDSAIQTMSQEEKDNTSLIIAMAGCNDLLNDVPQTDIVSGFNRSITKIAAEFTNAKVLVIPFNWGACKMTFARRRIMNNSITAMKGIAPATAKVAFVNNATWWNFGVFSHFQNEVHPNETGYRTIFWNIMSALFGGSTDAFLASAVSFASGTGSLNWEFKNGIITGDMHFYGQSALTNYGASLNAGLHPLLVPEYDIWIPLMSNDISSGTNYAPNGMARLASTTTALIIRVANLPATEVIYGSFSYGAACNRNWSS